MMDSNIELTPNERSGAGVTMGVSAKAPSATIEVVTTQGPRGEDGRGITSATVDKDGCLIIVFDDRTQYKSESLYVGGGENVLTEIPIASATKLGGVIVSNDSNMSISDQGILTVKTATEVTANNSLPVTSGAV